MFYSACVSALYMGQPLSEALSNVRAAGMDHYEFWGWWDQDLDRLEKAQRLHDVTPVALCTRMIPLTDPAQRDAYIAGLTETIDVCKRLGCQTIISQVGQELEGVPRQAQHDSIVQGLVACVPLLAQSGLTLVIEPLNTKVDHPGYYLWRSAEAFQIVDQVGDAHVKVLFDLYHQHIMEGLQAEHIVNNLEKIGHFHMAGFPGRHEPLIQSEIDYATILRAIRLAGYEKGIGLEYFPSSDPDAGLRTLLESLRGF